VIDQDGQASFNYLIAKLIDTNSPPTPPSATPLRTNAPANKSTTPSFKCTNHSVGTDTHDPTTVGGDFNLLIFKLGLTVNLGCIASAINN